MVIPKKYPIVAIGMLSVLLLLISACSQPGTGGTSSLTPLQVIQNSTKAMKQLKSLHTELQSSNHTQISSATSGVPSDVSTNIMGNGDQMPPNQAQMNLTVNGTTHVSQVIDGDKVYVQNAQGQWYVLSKSTLEGAAGNPFSSVNIDQNGLLGLIEHAKITDHGADTLNGQSLRHISADLDKTALHQLLTDNPQLQGILGQQNIDNVLDKTKSFQSTIDVWIDEANFYVHRTQLKLKMTVDSTGVTGTGASTTMTDLSSTVDLSKFNEPVTITPPTNAIPTNHPSGIFGFGKL